MGKTSLGFLILGIFLAAYIYKPLPDNVEEPWKIMLLDASLRTSRYLAWFAETLGLSHFMEAILFFSSFQSVSATSDKNITVRDTTFNNIPVRIYVPQRKTKSLRRSLFYVHGGGWCLGSNDYYTYDLLSRWTADKLDAVVISTNYRLAPKYHFPVQFEDVYIALKWFLDLQILKSYGVDPERIGISGDSAGGNLAAAVTQRLLEDPDVKIKLKVQSLIYPALQNFDFDLPSYRENAHYPVLPKLLTVRFWSEYFTTDRSLRKAMLSNQHIPLESSHLFKFVNWSSLLPEKFKKGHIYKTPTHGSSELAKRYPGILDVKASPLLADDSKLRGLPLTYVVTCQYDVLRDDGLMYVTRLQNSGVRVVHNHIEGAFHGTLSFLFTKVGSRAANQYISWLHENL